MLVIIRKFSDPPPPLRLLCVCALRSISYQVSGTQIIDFACCVRVLVLVPFGVVCDELLLSRLYISVCAGGSPEWNRARKKEEKRANNTSNIAAVYTYVYRVSTTYSTYVTLSTINISSTTVGNFYVLILTDDGRNTSSSKYFYQQYKVQLQYDVLPLAVSSHSLAIFRGTDEPRAAYKASVAH